MSSFSISRVFSAPRSLVFECWINPLHLVKWNGPAGCTNTLCHADVTPGGYVLLEQHGPEEFHLFVKYAFHKIDPIERLAYVTTICNEQGEIVTNVMVPSWPRTILTTIVFEDVEQGTRVTARWEPLDATADETEFFMNNSQEIGQAGWTQGFDRLDVVLEQIKLGT